MFASVFFCVCRSAGVCVCVCVCERERERERERDLNIYTLFMGMAAGVMYMML